MILFWNVDTQYDFIEDEHFKGTLIIPNSKEIRPNLLILTELAKDNDIKVINTADWHNNDSMEISETPDFVNTFPAHCIKNTKGAEFISETCPENPYIINWETTLLEKKELLYKRNIIIYKDKFDVFLGNKETENILDYLKPNKIIVYGVAANVCVNYAVMNLIERGFKICVVKDAIKDIPSMPSVTTEWIKKGIKLIKTKDILNEIKN